MTLAQKIKKKFRYGMWGLMIQGNLARIGLKFAPYILFEENRELYETSGPDSERRGCPVPRVEDPAPGFLERSDMAELASHRDYEYSNEQLLERMDSGNRCFGIRKDGKIIAWVWCNHHTCLHPPLRFPIQDHEAYFYDAFTIEEFRGKALSPYIRYQLYMFSEEFGRNTAYSVAEYYNTPAVRAQQRMGAIPLQLYFYMELFGRIRWNRLLKDYQKKQGPPVGALARSHASLT
ncbi:hypothetical protein ABI59_19375 [Acidobacteria bacterium Mor1]|nr:hypothetical protein ABI59_19375 [Acidobacteria bacterium Mor1]